MTYLYYKLSKLYQLKNDYDNAKIYAEMSKGCVEGMKGRLVGRVIYNWGILQNSGFPEMLTRGVNHGEEGFRHKQKIW